MSNTNTASATCYQCDDVAPHSFQHGSFCNECLPNAPYFMAEAARWETFCKSYFAENAHREALFAYRARFGKDSTETLEDWLYSNDGQDAYKVYPFKG